VFYLSSIKSLYASIPNYLILEVLPIFFLAFFAGRGAGFTLALYVSLKDLFSAWKKLFEMF